MSLVTDPFPEDEAPTQPEGLEHRAARLLSNWRQLPTDKQLYIERTVALWIEAAKQRHTLRPLGRK